MARAILVEAKDKLKKANKNTNKKKKNILMGKGKESERLDAAGIIDQ